MKKIVTFITLFFLATFLIGCGSKKDKPTPESIEIVSATNIFDETFKLDDLSVRVHMSDGTSYDVTVDETMIATSDLKLLNQEGTHDILVNYLDLSETFKVTITATDGKDGREVQLQTTAEYIQWRYAGETAWKNLIALNLLKGATGATGAAGTNGAAGKQVEFNVSTTHIQWRYSGDTTWINLIDLASLKGANGTAATISINDAGYWVINGTATSYKAVSESEPYTPPKVKVSFDLKGGVMPTGVSTEITNISKGDIISLPIPTKDYYCFKGWFNSDCVHDEQFLSFMGVDTELNLYAKWETDYAPIEELFNIVNSYNYTLTKGLHVKTIADSFSQEFQFNETEAVNKVDDKFYVHFIQSEKAVLPIANEDTNEYYALYDNSNSESFIYSKDTKYGRFYMRIEEDYYDNYNIRELIDSLDLSLFTKRPDSLIYDYPFNEEMQYLLEDMPLDLVTNTDIYLDLEAKKFVYRIEFTGEYEGEQITSLYESEFQFTNVGTTDVTFPLEMIKTNLISYINEKSSSNKELLYASPESLADYNGWLAKYIARIEGTENLYALDDYYNYFEDYIQSKSIILTPLESGKASIHTELETTLEDYSEMATEQSVLAMKEIYDAAILDLKNITTESAFNDFYQNTIFNLHVAYIIDPEVELFDCMMDRYSSNFNIIYNISREFTESSRENNYLDRWNWDIDYYLYSVGNIDELNAAYEKLLEDFYALSITLTDEELDLAKTKLLNQILSDYSEIQSLDKYYPNLDSLYKEVMKDVLSHDNLGDMIVSYGQFSKNFYDDYLSALRNELLEGLEITIRPYLLAVKAEDEEILNTRYNRLKLFLNNLHNAFILQDEYISLVNTINSYQYDSFILFREGKIIGLNDYLAQQEGPTEASLLAMQAIVDEAIVALRSQTTELDCIEIFNTAKADIDLAFDFDFTKQVNPYATQMERMTEWFNSLFIDEYCLLDRIFANENNLLYSLANVDLAIEEVEDWLVLVEAIPFECPQERFDNATEIILDEVEDLYNTVISAGYEDLPEDFDTVYDTSITAIELLNDPYDFVSELGDLYLYLITYI